MSEERRRRRANFKLIEAELRYYSKLKKELADAREDIIEGTSYPDVPTHTGPGNTVLSKVLRLTTSASLLETQKRIEAVEYALCVTKRHDGARMRLVEMKYFDNKLTDAGIMQELCVGRDTFYRWRRDFVQLVAERLGWEV